MKSSNHKVRGGGREGGGGKKERKLILVSVRASETEKQFKRKIRPKAFPSFSSIPCACFCNVKGKKHIFIEEKV
jgi:hypothetical protein